MGGILNYSYTVIWIIIYLLILSIFVGSIVYFVAAFFRKKSEKAHEYGVTFLQIKLPQDNEIEIKAAEQLFSGLMGFRKSFWQAVFTGQRRVSFEIVSKSEGIGFYVVVPDDISSLVEKYINGAYPSAEIDIIDPNEIWDRGVYTAVAELKLAGPPYYPIKRYEDLGTDALNIITSSMSKLQDDEVLAVQYLLRPAIDSWRLAGRGFVNRVNKKNSDPEKKSTSIDSSFLEGVEKKIAKPGFDTAVRLISISKDKISTDAHLKNLEASFEQFTDVSYNRFQKRKFVSQKKLIDNFIYRKLYVIDWHIPVLGISIYKNTSVLNSEELATIFHLPNKNVQTPNILWLRARRAAAPVNLPDSGLYLGKSIFRGDKKKIFLKEEDRRRHTYIIGQTGTGKSVLLMSLALQDIKNGKGVAIIDPHGTDIDDILEKMPTERIEDVILFDVSDTTRPIGLNLLEADTEEQQNMLINAFIALLYKLYDPNKQGIMGPQLERAIRNVMLTAMVDKESTMVDVLRLFIDQKYSEKFLPNVTDPLVRRYWTDEVAKTSENRKGETMGYFVSKFDRIVTEKIMRNIIGQPHSAINFGKIMAEKKILLVDLSKGKIGEENANFIGLLLVPRILAAAMGRHTLVGKEDFPDFYLYVDEFQNFATPDFATILSEARKYKLNLIVANQFIAQLTDDIKNAVFGNVGTTIAFRVGADDGKYLETQFDPVFKAPDLINNPIGNAYIKLLVDGHPTPPFSISVDWESITATKKDPNIAKTIREMSRLKYGTPVSEVEENINKRAGFTDTAQELKPNLSSLGKVSKLF